MEITIDVKDYEVVCKTKDCENGGIKIVVKASTVDPYIICGVCEQQITDITPVAAPK